MADAQGLGSCVFMACGFKSHRAYAFGLPLYDLPVVVHPETVRITEKIQGSVGERLRYTNKMLASIANGVGRQS